MPYEHSLKDLGLLNWRKGGGFLVKSAIVNKTEGIGIKFILDNRTEESLILVQINSSSYPKGDELLHELLSAPYRQDILEITTEELKQSVKEPELTA